MATRPYKPDRNDIQFAMSRIMPLVQAHDDQLAGCELPIQLALSCYFIGISDAFQIADYIESRDEPDAFVGMYI